MEQGGMGPSAASPHGLASPPPRIRDAGSEAGERREGGQRIRGGWVAAAAAAGQSGSSQVGPVGVEGGSMMVEEAEDGRRGPMVDEVRMAMVMVEEVRWSTADMTSRPPGV